MSRARRLGFAMALAGCVDQPPQSSAPPETIVPEAELQEALETLPSGTAVTWQVAADGSLGTVMPVRTFRTLSGYCREYLVTLQQSGGADNSWRSVACRDTAGIWRVFATGA